MTYMSSKIGPLVGMQIAPAVTYVNEAGEEVTTECKEQPSWFGHVSERMMYALGNHPHGAGSGCLADGQMNRGQFITTNDMIYVSKERGINHPEGTAEAPYYPKAGERILMGQLSCDSRQRNMRIRRSCAGDVYKKYKIQIPGWVDGVPPENPNACELVESDCKLNDCYVDSDQPVGAFPKFRLYATMISDCHCHMDTYQLACVEDDLPIHFARDASFFVGVPNTQVYGPHACWIVWMELDGDVTPNSFIEILADQIVK